ncbi:putative reductase [Staphylococcus aureus]|nr:hypothetical protein QU40_03635 [Staphylococcus aureus]SRF52114.1 putative reductase [Staphylococcus aureus]SRF78903.1 putative reductase [Staphylococcus aureus]SRG47790.1 putative reductase [Staphylococcus aureus]
MSTLGFIDINKAPFKVFIFSMSTLKGAFQKVATKKLPDFILSLGAKFNHQAKEGKLLLDMNRNVSNERAKTLLGWEPIATQEEAILAAIDSMAKFHLI